MKYNSYNSLAAWTAFIRSMIDIRGLPSNHFILAQHDHMVRWDCETGEVKTLEYRG